MTIGAIWKGFRRLTVPVQGAIAGGAIGLFLGASSAQDLPPGSDWEDYEYQIAGVTFWGAILGMLITWRFRAFFGRSATKIKRGSQLITAEALRHQLNRKQSQEQKPKSPPFEIAAIPIPNFYENLGFFMVGSPGSGKSQAIKAMLHTMRQREDFRAIIFDRNGELMESFYDEVKDFIFNPRDGRSLCWGHVSEGVRPETIAAAILPEGNKDDAFFYQAARALLSDLYKRCDTNAQIWEVLTTFTTEELQEFVQGGLSQKYFVSEKTAGSVLSTLVNDTRFYEDLIDSDDTFSFYKWAQSEESGWLWLPLFEDDAEIYQPIYTAAFELALRGLLTNEEREIKTAFVIDELGALKKLKSLSRLVSESRKFKGTLLAGTQTDAQITKVYGQEDTSIILQGCATKLILNCRDSKTAERVADQIGKQEVIEYTQSKKKGSLFERNESESIREKYTVMPSELQSLPSLEGYLTIADGTPPAKVQIQPRGMRRWLSDWR